MSERRACLLVNQPGGTQRYQPTQREDEDALTQAIIELAGQYGRTAIAASRCFLQRAELASRQGPGRTHLAPRRAEGSPRSRSHEDGCGSMTDHVCGCVRSGRITSGPTISVSTFTQDGRTVRMLNLIDEFTQEMPGDPSQRRLNSQNVIEWGY